MGSSILRAVAKASDEFNISIFDTDNNKMESLKNELNSSNIEIFSYDSIEALIKNSI